jgi:hypothetical protein
MLLKVRLIVDSIPSALTNFNHPGAVPVSVPAKAVATTSYQ